MKRILAILTAALALMAVSCEGNKSEDDDDDTIEVTEANLQGTWEGAVEHDFAQGYPQKWRIQINGKEYTTWHTHQTAGSINDDVQGLKTVGNKEKGTWAYAAGVLTLTPKEQYASYAITSMSPTKYSYYKYNEETMEAEQWYETSSALIEDGIARDIADGTDWYISKWKSVSLTKTTLTITINRDTFVLEKK